METTFDLAFALDGPFMFVADGANSRGCTVDLTDFAILFWVSSDINGHENKPRGSFTVSRWKPMAILLPTHN